MASCTKPDFMPPRGRSQFQRGVMRTPRFHEDFDAPFSEALMNDSTASNFTASCSRSLSQQTRQHPKNSKNSPVTMNKPQIQKSSTMRWHDDDWRPEPKRRSSVNDKVRQWAKKSLIIVRQQRSAPADGGHIGGAQRQATDNIRVNASSKDAAGFARSDSFPRAIITITEIPNPT